MKKTACILLGLSLLSFFSCKEKKGGKTDNLEMKNSGEEELVYEDYEFIDPDDFFELDYRPEKAEEKIGYRKAQNQAPLADKSQTTSFIPGLRPLNEYKTDYTKKKISMKSFYESFSSAKSAAKAQEEEIKI
ncbi:MAG: hypothetical protein K6E78_00340, partial [Treponema sp.]|nr:hypothetical protein [Treponema sp.]